MASLEERRNAEWARIRGRLRADFGDGTTTVTDLNKTFPGYPILGRSWST